MHYGLQHCEWGILQEVIVAEGGEMGSLGKKGENVTGMCFLLNK